MVRKRAARGDTLAGEAWAAGCRDVQAAINWATARGEVAGRPFQAAFRRAMAAHDAAPLPTGPPAASVTDPGAEAVGGKGKRARHSEPAPAKRPGAAAGRARGNVTAAGADTNGHPAPVAESAMAPAEFVADLKDLRRLVNKYGKKGLADLVSLLGS